MIAMSLATKLDLLADEPTTARRTVQARILKILRDLRDDLGIAVLFVTHDLGVVADAVDRVVAAYRGKIVEQGKYGKFSKIRPTLTQDCWLADRRRDQISDPPTVDDSSIPRARMVRF